MGPRNPYERAEAERGHIDASEKAIQDAIDINDTNGIEMAMDRYEYRQHILDNIIVKIDRPVHVSQVLIGLDLKKITDITDPQDVWIPSPTIPIQTNKLTLITGISILIGSVVIISSRLL
jgi:hypothetical protein